jgi:hypothetical protein
MADQKALVTLKDGSKIEVTDLAELSKYSDRQDLDSISFFGDEAPMESAAPAPIPAALINATLSIDTSPKQETITTVEQPKADPTVPKPPPAGDGVTTITITIGALAGAASSAGMPALTNLAKSFLKNKLKFKKKGGDSKPEEEKEEPTDCKTHQLKAGAKFASLNARLSALEGKNSEGDSQFSKLNSEDIEERLEKLEKAFKVLSKKGKNNAK